MAENEKEKGTEQAKAKAPETKSGELKAPTPAVPQFSRKLSEKYEISAALQPSRVDFGMNCGSISTDLTHDSCVAIIDAMVVRYPAQPYFKAKK